MDQHIEDLLGIMIDLTGSHIGQRTAGQVDKLTNAAAASLTLYNSTAAAPAALQTLTRLTARVELALVRLSSVSAGCVS
jgi:hypothetical protein